MGEHYDILLKNGTIVDGMMMPAYRGSIGIRDGKIARIGDFDATADDVRDVNGCIVSPGFVEMHAHMDAQVFWDGLASPSSAHGFTSMMLGNCGFGVTPVRPDTKDWALNMLSRVEGIPLPALTEGLPVTWSTFGGYLDAVSELPLAINIGAFVPHSNLRYDVMGRASCERVATEQETEEMVQTLREALASGGFGFSSSWAPTHYDGDGIPVPSRQSNKEELLALAGAMKDFPVGSIEFAPSGIFDGVSQESIDVMADMSRASGKPLNWNILLDLSTNDQHWREELRMMAEQNQKGARLFALCSVFPIDADLCFDTAGNMFDEWPNWTHVLSRPPEEKRRLLKDPEARAKMMHDYLNINALFKPDWNLVSITGAALEENQHLVGTTIADLAERQGKHPLDAMLDLAVAEDLKTQFMCYSLQNSDSAAVSQILQQQLAIPGVSDAGAHLEFLCQYGWSTRFLSKYVRDDKVMSIEEAIRRITYLPAQVLGLKDRGCLREGAAADIVVMDLDNLELGKVEWRTDLPGGQSRQVHYPTGFESIIVNGVETFRRGEYTGNTPGRLLRSTD